jgi:hypothetical protein
MNLLWRLAGFNAVDEVIRKRGKDAVAAYERFTLFELIGLTIANADSFERNLDGDFEDKDVVWGGGEFFVGFSDGSGIKSTKALIGHGGKVVAIENDSSTPGEGRVDESVDVVAPVEVEEVEFFLRREATGRGGVTQAFPMWAVGGLLRSDDFMPVLAERVGEEFHLGGFPGAVDSLEDNEH